MSKGSAFARTNTEEPHRVRRRALLAAHPEVRRLYGHDTRTAWITGAIVIVHIAIAIALQRAHDRGDCIGSWWVTVLFAYGIGAVLAHWLACTVHETTHDLAFESPRMNMALAIYANLAMVVPFAMSFRRYHPGHHAWLGVEHRDTDLPLQVEVVIVGATPARKFWWVFWYFFVYVGRAITFSRFPRRSEMVNALLVIAADIAIVRWIGPFALAYLMVSLVLGHSLHPIAGHFVHEHYSFRDGQETYSYYGPLNLVTFNVGYHNEHHDLPRIPGWRLPELRRIASEFYEPLASHRSWTAVLVEFITSPHVGVASRIVRTRVRGDAVADSARNPRARRAGLAIR